MTKKVIDKSGYNGGTVESPAVITKPQRKSKIITQITQDVKNPSKSAKPSVKKSKTPQKVSEEIVEAHENGTEVVVDERGMPSVSDTKVVKRKSYNLGGRPTKYREEYADMLIDFTSGISQEIYIDRKYYDRKVRGEFDDDIRPDKDGYKRHLIKDETHKVIATTFPTLERFAFMIDVHKDTLLEWSNAIYPTDYREKAKAGKLKYPRFSVAYARAKQMQESILIENGLN